MILDVVKMKRARKPGMQEDELHVELLVCGWLNRNDNIS
jgi:hypothetical protein